MRRLLTVGVKGADVRQLEVNLAALGYTGLTVDDTYTAATSETVKRWQGKLGLAKTGTVNLNEVAIASGQVRVSQVSAHLGDEAKGPVLMYTATTRVVNVSLDVGQQNLVRLGLAAKITLPGGKTIDGSVSTIGTVVTGNSPNGQQQEGGGSGPPKLSVTFSVPDQGALGTLDSAPVDVTVVAAEIKDVLTVPVAALVALAEGGYGVQVIEGSTSRYAAVHTGTFAGGQVEISGPGIVEGTVVGMPQ